MNEDIKMFIWLAFWVILVTALLTGLIVVVETISCENRADKMGFESDYGILQGCMWNTPKGWINDDNYRMFDDGE